MIISPELLSLGSYLAGEFDNREQAIAEPAWYVHLRLWQRPINLFPEDSLTLFAEQASVVQINQPYRQRIMRLRDYQDGSLQVQYYMLKNPDDWRGAGQNPGILNYLTAEAIELLPGCVLQVSSHTLDHGYKFTATQPTNTQCCFQYAGQTIQVALGFIVTPQELFTYDKGIDRETGKATWGAILGPYRYSKRENYFARAN
ncbi:chromophore lyase CpcT/CpeT [Calothrix sp. 336/3]|uniref:chromophore lyase CpcT/CpeT n=1 Tax=Calothrix sp. 336/3 TaxID=1337936 RepID=UPI0004E2ECA4|nr:chromophore lyase CpcT/CpeT [Calothrix sp. 336/3]AKG22517.1 chorismate mutase [Calothrix sp. 336/3]